MVPPGSPSSIPSFPLRVPVGRSTWSAESGSCASARHGSTRRRGGNDRSDAQQWSSSKQIAPPHQDCKQTPDAAALVLEKEIDCSTRPICIAGRRENRLPAATSCSRDNGRRPDLMPTMHVRLCRKGCTRAVDRTAPRQLPAQPCAACPGGNPSPAPQGGQQELSVEVKPYGDPDQVATALLRRRQLHLVRTEPPALIPQVFRPVRQADRSSKPH